MASSFTPSNIVGAALLMQVSIYLMVAVALAIIPDVTRGASILRENEYTGARSPRTFWVVFALFLITLCLLLLSDAFAAIWGPMYGVAGTSMMSWSTSLFWVFIANYGLLGALCWITGASRSPFISLILALPALSLFLRESSARVVLYAVLSAFCSIAFTLASSRPSGKDLDLRWRLAQIWMTAATLFFGTWIGLITRPA